MVSEEFQRLYEQIMGVIKDIESDLENLRVAVGVVYDFLEEKEKK